MSQNPAFDKLIRLLKELFQLDQPDLDFGLYRIMHARADEISQFLDRDLLPQVKNAFSQYRTADKAELEKELQQAIEQANGLGVDPETTGKVKELRQKIAEQGVDVTGLEQEVYDHLYKFFRRYYHEGDFLAKRVYKPGVYAIPYEGEEVKLHWANKDQYYIKTAEYLRDYAFTLKPGDDDPMRVHFQLVDAAEGEHGNLKETEGNNRVFVLANEDFIAEEEGESGLELVLRFEYRPATMNDWSEKAKADATAAAQKKPPTQKDLRADAVRRVLAVEDDGLKPWLAGLAQNHIKADGEAADYSRLAAHLNRYTARNTFDYFIHKDLGGFLRRELDFYIKNEIMFLDDIESETAPRAEQYLSKIKVIRQIAGKIIDFLAQLENFQRKLWLKKKFVTETSYCIRIGCIPEDFYLEIAANDAQRREWDELHAIDELEADLTTVAYSEPLTGEFLKAHPTLMVDTRHFDEGFSQRLLEAMGDIDGQTDGVLFHSENFQALSIMHPRFKGNVGCIYIDPPFNLGENGDFLYRTDYKDSTWTTLLFDRINAGRSLLNDDGFLYCRCDINGNYLVRSILNGIFGPDRFEAELLVQRIRKNVTSQGSISMPLANDSLFMFAASEVSELADPFFKLTSPREAYWRRMDDSAGYRNPPERRIFGATFLPYKHNAHFKFSQKSVDRKVQEGEVRLKCKSCGRVHAQGDWLGCQACGKSEAVVQYLVEETDKRVLDTNWTDIAGYAHSTGFSTENSVALLKRAITVAAGCNEWVLDFFAGSGTTAHAAIELNRDDSGSRRFILVESGSHIDSVILPRLKRVTFSPSSKDGKPKRLATDEEAERSPRIMKVVRLESYEDALNNLEPRRSDTQDDLLTSQAAQGADGLREQYLLRYMLDVENRGSQSLLNIGAFTDPTAYKLKVKRPGSEETREVNVDLLETFNWLIGLTVETMAAPQMVNAQFKRDDDPDLPEENSRRLLLDGRIREAEDGPWWFRTVTGTTPDGRKTLLIWRKLTCEHEQDNLVLDEWFKKQGYSSKDSEFDLIYVNGDNNLENLRQPDDTWKVRLIEEDFHRLMFEEAES